MTEAEFAEARRAVIEGGEPSQALLDQCRRVVLLLARNAGLPAHYSPYGVWSDEAIDEVFADWMAERLVARGQLQAMLQRAPVLAVFRRMAETSVRQHLLDRLPRSQAANLFERISSLLLEGDFAVAGTGNGRLWSLPEGPEDPFEGEDRQLLGVAWSLGDFKIIRYDIEAKKLSPLLDRYELERFVRGMLGTGSMTAGTLVNALRLRFDLEEGDAPEQLPENVMELGQDPGEVPAVGDLVTATLAELTDRQARVLIGIEKGLSGREIGEKLGVSTGTVSHERSRLEEILARLGTDAPDVLKEVLDALFKEDT